MRRRVGAFANSSAWASVLMATNETPGVFASIMRLTAFEPPPPTPATISRAPGAGDWLGVGCAELTGAWPFTRTMGDTLPLAGSFEWSFIGCLLCAGLRGACSSFGCVASLSCVMCAPPQMCVQGQRLVVSDERPAMRRAWGPAVETAPKGLA